MSADDAGLSLEELAASVLPPIIPQNEYSRLPILQHESNIGRLLNTHRTLLVLGETSCGKSTQLPQMFVRLGWTKNTYKVAVVQPNKLTAKRLAERLGDELGNRRMVSVSIAEDDDENAKRKSNYAEAAIVVFDQQAFLTTDGFGADPSLSAYSLIFVDEVHERTVAIDLIFGLLRRLMEVRSELRVVLASATLDTRSIARYFPSCSSVICEGRRYPVHMAYLKDSTPNYLKTCVEIVEHIHKYETQGDILIFVPTREDCEELTRVIQDTLGPTVLCVPLHAGMAVKDQQIVISATSSTQRKIIASTNIAETSISIPNISFVIDSMFTSETVFDAQSGLASLVTRSISKSKADQRAGRSGRIAPGGKCFRLCTEIDFRTLLPRHDDAEILRSDLVDVVLRLKRFGIEDVVDFPYISIPSPEAFIRAFDILYALGALNDDAELTDEGLKLSQLPLSASLGKVVLRAFEEHGSSPLMARVVDLAAMLGSGVAPAVLAGSALNTLVQHGAKEGDHLTLCNLAKAADGKQSVTTMESYLRFRSFRTLLKRVLAQMGMRLQPSNPSGTRSQAECTSDGRLILRCLVSGYFVQAAKLQPNGHYLVARDGRAIQIHKSSVLARFGKPPEWICFHEAVLLSSSHRSVLKDVSDHSNSAVVRIVSAIDPRWLLELAPHFWRKV